MKILRLFLRLTYNLMVLTLVSISSSQACFLIVDDITPKNRSTGCTFVVSSAASCCIRRPLQTTQRKRRFLLLAAHPANKNEQDDTTTTPQDDSTTTNSSNERSYYKSRSTFSPNESCRFHEGSSERAQRLDQALRDIGIDPAADLLQNPIWKGSAPLRTYSSFVLPKSAGALAMTQQPQRATVVANSISFLMREHRAHHDAWIRNHDRSLQETEEIWSLLQLESHRGNNNSNSNRNPITVILDDIRSAANVGNILRCAEAARCQQVLLCGSMTPSPPHAAVLKTAVGAAEYVPFQQVASTLQAIRELRQQNPNMKVFGVETTSQSIPLWQVDLFPPQHQSQQQQPRQQQVDYQIALVFGNELVGVDTNVLQECDALVSVLTFGIKNSLNVATCASIVIWEALRQQEQFFYREQQQQV